MLPSFRLFLSTEHGDDLDSIYEGVNLSRRERRALGQFAAEMQRRRLVDDFETALAAGDISDEKVAFLFQGLFWLPVLLNERRHLEV